MLRIINDENRRRVLSFAFGDGDRGSMSVQEILFHTVNYGSCHFGSTDRALDLAGGP